MGRDLVDLHCAGWADREQRIAMRSDHLFRAFSNTKLLTSCATMLLVQDGKLALDDPIGQYIAQLADERVLRPSPQPGLTTPSRRAGRSRCATCSATVPACLTGCSIRAR